MSHNEVLVLPRNHKTEAEVAAPEQEYQIQYVYPNGEIASNYNPDDTQEQSLQEESKEADDIGYQASEGDEKQQYLYVSQEETAEESQRSTVATKLQNTKQDEKFKKPKVTIKEEYEKIKIMPQLPVDLSLLKPNLQQVDVSLIKPVELNIHENEFEKANQKYKNYQEKYNFSVPDPNVQTSHELSPEELQKFLQEYYASASKPIVEPQSESGFRPMRNKPNAVVQPSDTYAFNKPSAAYTYNQPSATQTYRSNKKPATTPGLGSYSSQINPNAYGKFNPRYTKIKYRGQVVPQTSQYEYGAKYGEKRRSEISRLYRSLPSNGYVRYAKHISYEH